MKHFITLSLIFIATLLSAQLREDFSDGDFSNDPSWIGDIDNFKVNEQFQLQLDAKESGQSSIFTKVDYPQDSITVNFYLKMTFAPSNNNYSQIYLYTTGPNLDVASALALRIGENGSNDAITLVEINEGEENIIATGDMGAVALNPELYIRAVFVDGMISIYTRQEGDQFYAPNPEIMAPYDVEKLDGYFGWTCKYSSTRKSSFYLDRIIINRFKKDTTNPYLIDVKSDSLTIQAIYSEPLKDDFDISNFEFKPENEILKASLSQDEPNVVILEVAAPLSSSEQLNLSCRNIEDLNGNINPYDDIDFFYYRKPTSEDLAINEVLTDPAGDQSDFFELYNKSSDYIDLSGLIISNDQNEQEEVIGDHRLDPHSYIAFSENAQETASFFLESEKNIVDQLLPSFNNAQANFTIKDADGVIFDHFDYDEDWHLKILRKTEGTSLERIDPYGETQDQNNWQSAPTSLSGGTPGKVNGNFITSTASEEKFAMPFKSFSPSNDGFKDRIAVEYNLEKSGFIANVNIYDAEGFHIKRIYNNQLLGASGIISWDGYNEANIKSNKGLYVIIGELFDEDGNKEFFKFAFALL